MTEDDTGQQGTASQLKHWHTRIAFLFASPQVIHPLLIKQGLFYDFLFIRSCFNILPLNTAHGGVDTHTKREQLPYGLWPGHTEAPVSICSTHKAHRTVLHTLTVEEYAMRRGQSEFTQAAPTPCWEAEVLMRLSV